MQVTIHGPNLNDQSKGTFHVHTADCRDNKREVTRNGSEYPYTIEAATRTDVALDVYSCHIDEAKADAEYYRANGQPDYPDPSISTYIADFHFAPCCDQLPT